MSRLIIDTDIAFGSPSADTDDAAALLFAFAHYDVAAVTPVGGNAAPDKASRNLDAILSAIGKSDVPHAFSSSKPMDPRFWVNSRWSSSPEASVTIANADNRLSSVELMRKTLEENDGIIIVSIGPMTNLGLLLTEYPEMAERIRCIVSMGGSIRTPGVAGGAAEFNILSDPIAASAVFRSGVETYLFPLDVTKKKKIFPETIASWRKGKLLSSFADAAEAFMVHRACRDGYSPPYAFLHDVLPLVYLARPELFDMRECSISVDVSDSEGRGTTVVDFRGNGSYIAADCDSEEIFSFVSASLIENYGDL